MEAWREIVKRGHWQAAVFHDTRKGGARIRLCGEHATEAEAVAAAEAAIKSGWAGTHILNQASARPSIVYELSCANVDELARLAEKDD